MSWLLFIDESGHDHKQTPLEVRGGVAIPIKKLWSFVQAWHRLETDAFGFHLRDYKKEAKGHKLLDRNRFKWANQAAILPPAERRKHAHGFVQKGVAKLAPSSIEFTAYGQACLEMARGVFELLETHDAKLFAAALPRGVKTSGPGTNPEFLRRDHVFLFERFFYFLEYEHLHGLIVMDETEKSLDRQFVSRMEAYFTRTATGRNRSYWIVPSPLFVSSEMSVAIQAADICLYAINWGFRLNYWHGIDAPRDEIAAEFGPKLQRLQWKGTGYRDGADFRSWGIMLVDDRVANLVPKK